MYFNYIRKIKKSKTENFHLRENVESMNTKIAEITARLSRAKYSEAFLKKML
jgi:predicted RNase H-like nuclease (RuvC/YqgF family)